jgi:DNA-binding beta-propeller fold protein YncE
MPFIKPLTLILAGLCTAAASVNATELESVASIAIPGATLTNFDISFIDQASQRYYFADRSNKSIDVFDVRTDRFIARVEGFVGVHLKNGKPHGDTSGPDGVLSTGSEIWAGDGNSTVKVIDATTLQVRAVLQTGGSARLDEMAYDPKDQVFIGVNNAEEPPYATLISTQEGHRVIGKLQFPEATHGAEQPQYNAEDGMFYMAIPELNNAPEKGGVAVIDPRTAKLVRMLSVEHCRPAGLAFGPNGNFLLGCSADGKNMPPVLTIMNAHSGQVVAVVPGIGGADMVDYNHHNGQYYAASRSNPQGPVLAVIDARTNTLVQTLALPGGGPHSLASSEISGKVYVPVGALNGGDGTIHVFAPTH